MGYHTLPEHIVPATDPLGQRCQRMLTMLDTSLILAFNTRLKRYEVWNKSLDSRGVFYGFVMRVSREDGGFAEPGDWLVGQLKARDSQYAGADEAAQNVLREIHESERRAAAEAQKRDDDAVKEVAEEIGYDYRLEAQNASDPHYTGRRHYDWDPEPVSVPITTPMRERIREEAKS